MSTINKEQAIFALSFISNANFGLDAPLGSATSPEDGTLWTNAQNQVNSGIAAINQNLPEGGEASLTWGPYIANSQSKDPDAPSDFVTDNAMYVASMPDPSTSNKQLLIVSLAGTSSTSYVAAMDEDFGVDMVPLNVPPGVSTSAQVYKGGNAVQQAMLTWNDVTQKAPAQQGFLANLVDQVGNLVLAKKSVEIVVTGHSLGGGLSPLLAAYLGSYSSITQHAGVSVSCYTYAGPTAGDGAFQSFLEKATANGTYCATVNPLDLVPMAWAPDTLPEIPNLYSSQEGCDGDIGTDYIFKGAIVWAQSLTEKNPDYEQASPENTNTLAPLSRDFGEGLCLRMEATATAIHDLPNFAKIKANMQTIWQKTTNTNDPIDVATIKHFLVFAAEGGWQHVRSYIDQLINPSEFGELNSFLIHFMNAGEGDKDAENYDSGHILNTILSEAADYLS